MTLQVSCTGPRSHQMARLVSSVIQDKSYLTFGVSFPDLPHQLHNRPGVNIRRVDHRDHLFGNGI